jgi:mono/diheme cytochrome c family protein
LPRRFEPGPAETGAHRETPGSRTGSKGGTIFMPSFVSAYSDAELAAVANYVIEHFGGKTGQVTAEDIGKGRSEAEAVAMSFNSTE